MELVHDADFATRDQARSALFEYIEALKVIQELMGHATIEMTMRYAHLSPEARERAVQELDRPIPQSRRSGLETPEGHTGGT
jgi:integrase